MASNNKRKIEVEVRAALEATGLPWEIKDGGKHQKVYLAGKFIVSLCRCPGERRDAKHALAKIRSRMRELQHAPDTGRPVQRPSP